MLKIVIEFFVNASKILVPEEDLENRIALTNPMTLQHLQATHPYFQWRDFIIHLMPAHLKMKIGWENVVNLLMPSYFLKLETLLKTTEKR